MPPSLLAYAWRFSWRDQLVLLAVTVVSFPLLYATLELPKQIINDAIGGKNFPIEVMGRPFGQLEYLALLCAGFLVAVVASGLVKMKLNTMKGVVAERLLRRLRFELVARIHRFPLSRFRNLGQGELTSIVTGEAEPLGGVMGELVAQPLFQAGQMLTILAFLMVQNVWFAFAAAAMIPVQAYIIPIIQRRVNRLHAENVQNVRRLAERIGETVAGMPDLRANNGVRYSLAQFSAIFQRSFEIRLKVFELKFFMKFLNNFINQLTPFLFFAIGGTLVIQGELTLGALVAALSAFKDLSTPWRELLTFYNNYQDSSVRYRVLIDQFDTPDVMPEALVMGSAPDVPSLTGPVRLENVSVSSGDNLVLADLSCEFPAGSLVGIEVPDGATRTALVQVLGRLSPPRTGHVCIGEHDLATLHQDVVARRIGVVTDQPFLFKGTIGSNIHTPLNLSPNIEALGDDSRRAITEASRVGNSADPVGVSWLDPRAAGVETVEDLRTWWLKIVETMDIDTYLTRRAIDSRLSPEQHPKLADAIVRLRPELWRRLEADGLASHVKRFDAEAYHPGLAVAENLLFAIPRRPTRADMMAADPRFRTTLEQLGVADDLRAAALDMLHVLVQTFGDVGTDHPLFRRLSLDPEVYERLVAAFLNSGAPQRKSDTLEALLLTLPFKLTAESFPDAVPGELRKMALDIRKSHGATLREQAIDVFAPLDPDLYVPGLTLLENALFGKIKLGSTAADRITDHLIALLDAEGLRADAAITIMDIPTNVGGTSLPAIGRERIAFVRAVIKRPDILILDRFLASHSDADRIRTRDRLRELLPDATIILFEPKFTEPEAYDVFLRIENGMVTGGNGDTTANNGPGAADLRRKVMALRSAPLFDGLSLGQIRLLAFASDWVSVPAGQAVFRSGDRTDGAYLLTSGRAELRWPNAKDGDEPLLAVEPGRVVGDLSVIVGSDRTVDMVTLTDIEALRIRNQEFRDIITSDARIASRLLETVAGYLVETTQR